MNGPDAFIGLDAGESLTLAGIWKSSPEVDVETLAPSWPLREPVSAIQAFVGSPAARVRAVQSLLACQSLDPARCILVGLRGLDTPGQASNTGGQASCPPPSPAPSPGSRPPSEHTPATYACELAALLGIPAMILPARACALTIRGLLFADQVKEYTRLVPPHAAQDLPLLREYFADMMEQAAEDVQVMGLEQDDSLLDHFADLRIRGEAGVLTVAVESLSDAEWLLRNFQAARALCQGQADTPPAAEVTAVYTRSLISTPQPGWRPGPPASAPRVEVPPGWTWRALPAGHVLCHLLA
jgi:hypothetical protein